VLQGLLAQHSPRRRLLLLVLQRWRWRRLLHLLQPMLLPRPLMLLLLQCWC
jgi:hypothetical protein